MNAQTTQVDDLRLIAMPSAVNCTYLFVQFTLGEWDLRPLLDETATVACQLVAEAVEATDTARPGFITVRLRLRGDCLVVEVEDEESARPGAAEPPVPGRNSGIMPLNRGKVVWCELPLPGGVTASSVALPRRERKSRPAGRRAAPDTADADVDPQVMERILYGLSRPADNI